LDIDVLPSGLVGLSEGGLGFADRAFRSKSSATSLPLALPAGFPLQSLAQRK
jgi:hypothetical protein